jgi:hypothetical protein
MISHNIRQHLIAEKQRSTFKSFIQKSGADGGFQTHDFHQTELNVRYLARYLLTFFVFAKVNK